jgi:hypothetical protein
MTTEVGTALDVADPSVSTPATISEREWAVMRRQADDIARSDIIPKAYRGRAANIMVAGLVGRQYGWDLMTAMRNGNVIEGSYDVSPEAALGLIRRLGHSVTIAEHRDDDILKCGVTVTGTRADNGDTMDATFTIGDAVRARLCTVKDGHPYARSSRGNPLPWEQYPVDMCLWRAVGRLSRRLFSDVGVGVYSASETTDLVDADGVEIDVGSIDHAPAAPAAPQPLSTEALEGFANACANPKAGPPVDPVDVLNRAFPDGVPDVLTDEHLPLMRDTFLDMVNEAGQDDKPPEPESEPPPPEPEPEPEPDDRPATRGMVGKIKAHYARLGIDDRDAQLAQSIEVIGRDITSHNHVTRTEAAVLLDGLARRKPDPDTEVAEGEIVQPELGND